MIVDNFLSVRSRHTTGAVGNVVDIDPQAFKDLVVLNPGSIQKTGRKALVALIPMGVYMKLPNASPDGEIVGQR